MLNGTAIETRIGIRIQGAEGASGVSAVQCLADGLGAIVVDAHAMGTNGSVAPRAVEGYILRAVNVVHVGSNNVGRLVDAVIVHILFVARNKTNRGDKESDCYQT